MTSKPKSAKAWAVLDSRGRIQPYLIYCFFGDANRKHPGAPIIRVLITEHPKKRRKK